MFTLTVSSFSHLSHEHFPSHHLFTLISSPPLVTHAPHIPWPTHISPSWQLPRTSHPPTRTGYLTWRAKQKSLAASQLTSLLSPTPTSPIQPSLEPTEIEHIASLVRKDGLLCKDDTKDKNEVQILEDVACLVFLDDQFDSFEQKSEIDEDKMVNILKKTWGKMGERGRELALGMELSERARVLIGRALEG